VNACYAHLLTVVGDAGIGKSRLVHELAQQLAGQATVLTGRCLSYGDGVAYWPLREAVVEAAGGESRDAIRTLMNDAADADLVADIIAATLGLAPAQTVGEQVPWAFRRLLDVLARRRPVILVMDDAHWAERPVVEIVDHLIDWLTAPVLLLCLGRPELLDSSPRWRGGHPRMRSVVLGRMSEGDGRLLLDQLLGERQLSAPARTRIVQTAEGNPLFVEQLLALATEEPRWYGEHDVPATIHSLLAARLDRIGPGERAFIRCAAVMGREFWPTASVTRAFPSRSI
jgi:predicted ATPase